MATQKDWKSHLYRVDQAAIILERLYDNLQTEISLLAFSQKIDPNRPFAFNDYPLLKNRVDEAIRKLANQIFNLVQTMQQNEWEAANASNDALCDEILKTLNMPKEIVAQWKDHNLTALSAFQQRKVNNMNLSERVWKLSKRFKDELELALDVGIGEAKSAAELSRDVRHLLKEPNRLYRRVRDKVTGKLQLSKAAKAYNPGPGIYRSSYKNAMRLTRTEISMAYRDADYQRWQQIDFVVGYEVRRSNNLYDCPICEPFKGFYPKTFKFVPWHPHCRCHAVSVLASKEELNEMEVKLLNGESLIGFRSKNTVAGLPDGYLDYIKGNKAAIAKMKKQPYFIRDNYKGGHIMGELKNLKME